MPLKDPFFLPLPGKSETLIIPKLCPWKSPKRIKPDRGSLALKLFTLMHRDEVSSLLPPALGFRCQRKLLVPGHQKGSQRLPVVQTVWNPREPPSLR